jgi:hypothetical protein
MENLELSTAPRFASQWFRTHKVNMLNIIALAMIIIEHSSRRNYLDGDDKQHLVLAYLPTLVNLLLQLSYITKEQATSFQEKIKQKPLKIFDTISTIASISNHPNLFQLNKWSPRKRRFCLPC